MSHQRAEAGGGPGESVAAGTTSLPRHVFYAGGSRGPWCSSEWWSVQTCKQCLMIIGSTGFQTLPNIAYRSGCTYVHTHNHNARGREADGVVGSAHILAKVGSRDIADEEVARVAPDSDLVADLLPMVEDT